MNTSKPYNYTILSTNTSFIDDIKTNEFRLVPIIGFSMAGILLLIIIIMIFYGYLNEDDDDEDFKELPISRRETVPAIELEEIDEQQSKEEQEITNRTSLLTSI